MMLAGQAVLGGIGQHAPQHAAQRVARQHIVSDMIGRHYRSCRVVCCRRITGDAGTPTRRFLHATPPAG